VKICMWPCWSIFITALALHNSAAIGAPADVTPDPHANALLEKIRTKHDVPGLVGAVFRGDRLVTIGASGVRKAGAPEPITVDDQVHLGSNTKSMTATRIALLVDEGKLSWSTTVGDVFPDLKATLHPDFQKVTLDHLLTHRAGLPHDGAYALLQGDSVSEKRLSLIRGLMKSAPASKPGTKMDYSNAGYIIAGAIAERVTGQSWEDLMREGLFKPLGMTSAGFGPPGAPGKVDQPWGHRTLGPLHIPSQGDNPPVIGPAGRVHASLADWGKYAAFHLHGRAPGGLRLKPETLLHLHTPPSGGDYACGWVVRPLPWDPGTKAIWHNGSNTMWYAEMWVDPAHDAVVLVATNQLGAAGPRACDQAAEELAALAGVHPPAAASPVDSPRRRP
jgi:CubicO group peptidase (beta-lactamase class C family)